MKEAASNRDLSKEEQTLVRWMLENSNPDARQFLPQLELAQVLPWRCPFGCASIDFVVNGRPESIAGIQPIADFVFGKGDEFSGIFVYEQSGILAGLKVYGLTGVAPKSLPDPSELKMQSMTLDQSRQSKVWIQSI